MADKASALSRALLPIIPRPRGLTSVPAGLAKGQGAGGWAGEQGCGTHLGVQRAWGHPTTGSEHLPSPQHCGTPSHSRPPPHAQSHPCSLCPPATATPGGHRATHYSAWPPQHQKHQVYWGYSAGRDCRNSCLTAQRGGHCQDPPHASGCPPSLVPLVLKGLILHPAPVPRSPVVPRAACRAPRCLLWGDAVKVSVFLARRGCPPVAAATPAPAPACRCAPAWHSCPREGAGSCLQRESALMARVHPKCCCPAGPSASAVPSGAPSCTW